MNEGHCYLWSLPDTELADFLNALGPDRVAALMTDHGTLGTVLNGTLDRIASDNATTRAIVGAGREITLTGGVFSVVPVVPEEPNEVQ
jgi:hypothetical protein